MLASVHLCFFYQQWPMSALTRMQRTCGHWQSWLSKPVNGCLDPFSSSQLLCTFLVIGALALPIATKADYTLPTPCANPTKGQATFWRGCQLLSALWNHSCWMNPLHRGSPRKQNRSLYHSSQHVLVQQAVAQELQCCLVILLLKGSVHRQQHRGRIKAVDNSACSS